MALSTHCSVDLGAARAGEIERLTLWRDEAMRDVQELKAEVERLREKAAAFDTLAEDMKQAAYRLLSVRRDYA